MTRKEYYIETIKASLDETGASMNEAQIEQLATDLLVSMECELQAFGPVENPLHAVVKRMEEDRKAQQKRMEAEASIYEEYIARQYEGGVFVGIRDGQVEIEPRR